MNRWSDNEVKQLKHPFPIKPNKELMRNTESVLRWLDLKIESANDRELYKVVKHHKQVKRVLSSIKVEESFDSKDLSTIIQIVNLYEQLCGDAKRFETDNKT